MSSLAAKWIRISLLNFLFAALIGLLLRYAFVNEIKWLGYKSFQDAHSSLALLGWIFIAVSSCLTACFHEDNHHNRIKYNRAFLINQVIILAATASYLVGLSKIISNALLITLSVSLVYFTLNFIRDTPLATRSSYSFIIAVTALIFLSASFLGLYAITPVLFLASAKKVLFYYLGVQFFLHFQYNGWFTFAILAFLFCFGEKKGITLESREKKLFLPLMIAGIVLSYFLSIYWGYRNHTSYLGIATAGTVIQLLALYIIKEKLIRIWKIFHSESDQLTRFALLVCACAFAGKMLLQLITAIPDIASLAFTIRNYVVAYLHLIFLGVMTMFLIAWAGKYRLIVFNKITAAGFASLITGFILMEILLVIQGTMLWTGMGFLSSYYEYIFTISIFLPAGLMLIIFPSLRHSYH